MAVGGLTKGSADRSALAAIMDGNYKLHHAVHEFREPSTSATAASNSEIYASGGGGASGASPAAVLEGGSDTITSRLNSYGLYCLD